jgi:GNAT superfamily N-acetyltransferase
MSEADVLADIRLEAMRPSLEAVGRFDPVRARARFLDGFIPEDTQVLCVAGRTAGVQVVRRRPDHLYLDHLYVHPEFQGLGLGRRVMQRLKEEARAAGLPIRLTALNGSRSNDFYRRCGFRAVAADALDTVHEWDATIP